MCWTFSRNICCRKSGPASITSVIPSVSIRAEVRSRLSRLSGEVQTQHPQEITGTPCEVPVPRNVSLVMKP